MEIVVKLLIVSINWMNGNFYVVLENGGIPQEEYKPSELYQPNIAALDIAEEIVPLSKQWMKCNLVNTYVMDDKLNIVYKMVIPHDPSIKLNKGSEWKDIKRLDLNDENLLEAIEESVRGIT